MSLSSPGIANLFEHSEWFQPLFAELDRRGIPYDRLLAAELSYDPHACTSQNALVVNLNRMSPSAYLRGHGNGIFFEPLKCQKATHDQLPNCLGFQGNFSGSGRAETT